MDVGGDGSAPSNLELSRAPQEASKVVAKRDSYRAPAQVQPGRSSRPTLQDKIFTQNTTSLISSSLTSPFRALAAWSACDLVRSDQSSLDPLPLRSHHGRGTRPLPTAHGSSSRTGYATVKAQSSKQSHLSDAVAVSRAEALLKAWHPRPWHEVYTLDSS